MRDSFILVKSLKEQIHGFLLKQFRLEAFKPGTYLNLDRMSNELGISRTALHEAVVQLESEGFVTIEPRRGTFINRLTVSDMKHIYKAIGALERLAILESAKRITIQHIEEMTQLNALSAQDIPENNMDLFTGNDFLFHAVYAKLTCNPFLIKTVNILKKRLQYFPYHGETFIPERAASNAREHKTFIEFLMKKQFTEAADFIQNTHWSFEVQERYIRMHYPDLNE